MGTRCEDPAAVDPEPQDPTVVLLTRAKAGNRPALGQLVERYQPRVLAMVRGSMGRTLRSAMDSADVVQDVMTEALRSLGKLESFPGWLRAAVESRLRNLSRSQRRRPAPLPLNVDPVEPREPSEDADGLERRRLQLESMKASLVPDQREVLKLRYEERLSYREIAARMGRTEAAVSMLLTRARHVLSTKLARP